MILSVLSGSQSITEATEEAKTSRATYYQLETRALKAMLQALLPGAETTGGGESLTHRLLQLERKISLLERGKRRAERLLYLTRQVLKPGPMSSVQRSRPGERPSSMKTGRKPLPTSSKIPESTPPSLSISVIPTPAGGAGPSAGSAS